MGQRVSVCWHPLSLPSHSSLPGGGQRNKSELEVYSHLVHPPICLSICPSFRHPSIHPSLHLIFIEHLLCTRRTTEHLGTESGASQDRTRGSPVRAPCPFLFFVSSGDGPGGTGWGSDGA